jgi:hypothetical protein
MKESNNNQREARRDGAIFMSRNSFPWKPVSARTGNPLIGVRPSTGFYV